MRSWDVRHLFVLTAIFFGASWVQAQPVVTAVQNGASYSPEIASGSIFVLRGSGLSDDGFIQAGSLPLETTLEGVSIRFSPVSGGAAVEARMIYVYSVGGVNQLAGLLPSSAAPGDYNVTVTRAGQTSAPARTRVVARNPGIFSANSEGWGQAQATTAAHELIRFVEGELGGFNLRPVYVGDAVVLWMTGLGADESSDLNGVASGDMTASAGVRVIVNGVEVTPFYAGRASGLPGTDQVNFIVPAGIIPSCDVSVQVVAGGFISNRVAIAVAAPGATACESLGHTAEELRTLTLGGTLRAGVFNVNNHQVENVFPGQAGPGGATSNFYGGVVDYTQNDIVIEGHSLRPGQCIASTRRVRASELQFGVVTYSGLDAGPVIAVAGPGIGEISAGKLAGPGRNHEYYAELASVGAGGYTLRAPGGADVGPFEGMVTVPEFEWTNRGSINSINRGGMSFTWSGGGAGWVNIVGFGAKVVEGNIALDYENAIAEGTYFSCIADAAAGSMTVPGSILSRVPPVPGDSPLGVYAHHGPARGRFQVPLVAGGTINGMFGYSLGFIKILTVE